MWELTRRVVKSVLKDDCDGYAAQIAFFFLFALFPCLLTLTTLLAYLPVPDLFRTLLKIMGRFVPGDVMYLVRENLRTLITVQQGGLLTIGVLLSVWTSSNAMIAIQGALNVIFGTKEQRSFWKVRVISVLLVICFTFFTIFSLIILLFGPLIGVWIASLAGLGDAFTTAWDILRWPVIICLMMTALSALYYYAPAVRLTWRETVPGAIAAAGVWVVVSLAFSYFVNNFGSYDRTYGSIGAVIALLVWMYTCGFIILLGGEINARWREIRYEKMENLENKGVRQMRKSLITELPQEAELKDQNWLDLLKTARVELTSEDPEHPIESALNPFGGYGWRAMGPGTQTIRLLFDEPLQIRHINLVFLEDELQRTQEFVVRWSTDAGRSYREIVRQQYTFAPPETIREIEDYIVDLIGVAALELIILPDINGGESCASLSELRIA
ncbi:MAG: YhjD/YihY/BrkB family envelope integrity protein [Desulfuromonadaceae bacterium]|nr:YhjD/YihY/BrkB family envelope integrity protein [Desulfuromonadaceae bacterium]MDD5105459.1 YhjD/YihY/BrkB family envelope integrity protein [Desulfuromonadaceae bacterium]